MEFFHFFSFSINYVDLRSNEMYIFFHMFLRIHYTAILHWDTIFKVLNRGLATSRGFILRHDMMDPLAQFPMDLMARGNSTFAALNWSGPGQQPTNPSIFFWFPSAGTQADVLCRHCRLTYSKPHEWGDRLCPSYAFWSSFKAPVPQFPWSPRNGFFWSRILLLQNSHVVFRILILIPIPIKCWIFYRACSLIPSTPCSLMWSNFHHF